MKNKSLLTAALASVLSLQCLPAPPASAHEETASSAPVQTASVTAGPSHAEAVYQASLPLLASSVKLPEAISYLNSNLYAVGSYRATVMVLKLENIQKAALPAWEDKFSISGVQRALTELYEPGDTLQDLADKARSSGLRAMLLRAKSCGYKLETAEGFFFPVIDYGSYRKYKTYVTGDIQSYISIMAVESDLPPAKDNGLIIAWADVVSRALSQETFIADYPRSNRLAQVKALYKMYENTTFYGLNNTPLFHYDNMEMDLEAEKAYLAALAKGDGDSPYLTKLSGFMKLLKDSNYKLTDEAEAYRKQASPQA